MKNARTSIGLVTLLFVGAFYSFGQEDVAVAKSKNLTGWNAVYAHAGTYVIEILDEEEKVRVTTMSRLEKKLEVELGTLKSGDTEKRRKFHVLPKEEALIVDGRTYRIFLMQNDRVYGLASDGFSNGIRSIYRLSDDPGEWRFYTAPPKPSYAGERCISVRFNEDGSISAVTNRPVLQIFDHSEIAEPWRIGGEQVEDGDAGNTPE